MPPQDSIDRFIALSRDKQLSALGKLSPADQDAVLGQVKQRRSTKSAAPAPGNPAAPNSLIEDIGKVGAGVARGIYSVSTPGVAEGLLRKHYPKQVEAAENALHIPQELRHIDPTKESVPNAVVGFVGGIEEEGARGPAPRATETVSKVSPEAVSKLAYASGKGTAALVQETLPEVLKIAKSEGLPPDPTVGDYLNVLQRAKSVLNDEYAGALGSEAKTFLRANPIAEKIRALKTPNLPMTEHGTATAEAVEQAAREFDKPWTFEQLDHERMQANARLTAYENKSTVDQYAALKKTRSVAIDKAIADGVRENVYPRMDELTGKPPGYFAALKQKIGNLLELQSKVEMQADTLHDTSVRAKGEPLTERLKGGVYVSSTGKPHGYLRGLKEAIMPDNPEAVANKSVAKAFKKSSPAPRTKASLRNIPFSSLLLAGTVPKGPAPRAGNPTDAWAGTHAQ